MLSEVWDGNYLHKVVGVHNLDSPFIITDFLHGDVVMKVYADDGAREFRFYSLAEPLYSESLNLSDGLFRRLVRMIYNYKNDSFSKRIEDVKHVFELSSELVYVNNKEYERLRRIYLNLESSEKLKLRKLADDDGYPRVFVPKGLHVKFGEIVSVEQLL